MEHDLLSASRQYHLPVLTLLKAVQDGKIRYQPNHTTIILNQEDVAQLKLEDRQVAKTVDDLLISEQLTAALKPFYILEPQLTGENQREVLQKIFTQVYSQLSAEQQQLLGNADVLYHRSMNLGVIELRRPAYRPEAPEILPYLTDFLPRDKVREILYRIGVKRFERARYPDEAARLMIEYLDTIKDAFAKGEEAEGKAEGKI